MLPAKRAILVAILLLVSAPMAADAHKPVAIGEMYSTFNEALSVDEIDVSQVAYAALDDTHRAIWLTFKIAVPTTLGLSLGLPVIERLVEYRPSLAVIGPGLPPIDLPFEAPATGGFLFETASIEEPRFFHEPFTGTDSWILLEASVDLPQPGVYYVVAWAPTEPADKLWVAIGTREQFGFGDLLSFGTIIRDVRDFHEIAPRPSNPGSVGKLLFLGLAAALIGLLVTGSSH
ncbi:hypothetical protein ACFLTM_03685 [Candidatus Bipolaricaulota bacterium]